jgi:hypothetical protein
VIVNPTGITWLETLWIVIRRRCLNVEVSASTALSGGASTGASKVAASTAVRSHVEVAGEHTSPDGQTPSGHGAPGCGAGE